MTLSKFEYDQEPLITINPRAMMFHLQALGRLVMSQHNYVIAQFLAACLVIRLKVSHREGLLFAMLYWHTSNSVNVFVDLDCPPSNLADRFMP